MPPVPPKTKMTPAQRFRAFFNIWMDRRASQGDRDSAKRKMDAWLERHGMTDADAYSILKQAEMDDPPPPDPRHAAPNPFEDPRFTPVGLVEGILKKYVTAKWHVLLILALYAVFTHLYTLFRIAPRVGLIGETGSGKTTVRKVMKKLVHRPNPESSGTGAAIREFLDGGPCTFVLDELDHLDADARRILQMLCNLGHERGEMISLMVGGRRKLVSVHAPMLLVGVGLLETFLAPAQRNRTFVLELKEYADGEEPEREIDEGMGDVDAVYTFVHRFAEKVRAGEIKLDPKPPMPGALRRFRDNVRGLLSIADACGAECGQRAREAFTFLLTKEKAERPEIVMTRHGLAIFDALEPDLDQIKSTQFNQELKRLGLPDATWTRYSTAKRPTPHPIEMHEQAALLSKVGIRSMTCWPPGARKRGTSFHGYKREQFEEAWRKHGIAAPDDAGPERGPLRLIAPSLGLAASPILVNALQVSSQVSGPMMEAGLPGLVIACSALLALARRRRQQCASHAPD
jgi:energy-coupling factor transporter ATP-binding protein EcfA2